MEVAVPTLRLLKRTAEARKRAKPEWPPVEEGGEFIVEKEDAEKWPTSTHTSTVATASFIVTALGVRCRELSCGNPGFAESLVGEPNHASSLHSCDKHVAFFHPPPTKLAPSVRYFSPRRRSLGRKSQQLLASQLPLLWPPAPRPPAPRTWASRRRRLRRRRCRLPR